MAKPRPGQALTIGWIVLLLLAPASAWLAGLRAQLVENRPLAPLPQPTSEALRKPAFYRQLSQALLEHNPLRSHSLLLKTRFEMKAFLSLATLEVVPGEQGWLALRASLERDCRDEAALAASVSAAMAWISGLRDSGKPVFLTVAPDKESIYPDYVPRLHSPEAECVRRSNALVRAGLRQGGAAYIDLFEILQQGRRQARPLYSAGDTHWTGYGSTLAARAMIERISPGLLDGARPAKFDESQVHPDLFRMGGLADHETRERWAWTLGSGRQPDRRRLLVIHDSFFNITRDQFESPYPAVQYLHWNDLNPERLQQEVAAAEVVLIETVERSLPSRFMEYFPASP
ncbi:MAG TPA: hypothetical protein VLI06_12300 [Solimonas sp.]|nr:hypothetical protein [Solimonas sp.]